MNDLVQKNIFGEPLESCSKNPLTGWMRDGCCNTDKNDRGVHTVCAKVSDKFLNWSKKVESNKGWTDHLSLSIETEKFTYWLNNEAYD